MSEALQSTLVYFHTCLDSLMKIYIIETLCNSFHIIQPVVQNNEDVQHTLLGSGLVMGDSTTLF